MEAKTKRSNFKITAIAVTEASQGGAASLMNDPLLLKSLKDNVELSDEQKALLEEMGYTESEIDKALVSGKESPSSLSEDSGGGDNLNENEGTDNTMSDELLKNLTKELASLKMEKALNTYNFEGGVATGVADALAELPAKSVESVTKAFDFLIECSEYAIALEKAKVSEVKEEENPLAKALSEELGEGGTEEAPVEKSFVEQVKEANEATKEA